MVLDVIDVVGMQFIRGNGHRSSFSLDKLCGLDVIVQLTGSLCKSKLKAKSKHSSKPKLYGFTNKKRFALLD